MENIDQLFVTTAKKLNRVQKTSNIAISCSITAIFVCCFSMTQMNIQTAQTNEEIVRIMKKINYEPREIETMTVTAVSSKPLLD